MSDFYDGGRLLSLSDMDGNKPEIYLCVGNRTAGKTFYFKRYCVNKFRREASKFAVLVRFKNELDGIEETFFKDIEEVSFQGSEFVSKSFGDNLFKELFIDGQHCGYAIALNSADTIKKYSSRFVDVDRIFFDEFQSEVGKYCPDEITKFQSVHTSIARGGGKHVRYVPVIMCSNTVSVINPYYTSFGIAKRLEPDTKFLRGTGWVLEQTYQENAATAIQESGFGKAFKDSQYMQFATNNSYLLDSNSFIENLDGRKSLFCVLVDGDKRYGVWNYHEAGLIAVTRKYDPRYPHMIAFRTPDHKPNYMLAKKNSSVGKMLAQYYEAAQVRFEDQECKNAFIEFIGYSTLGVTRK